MLKLMFVQKLTEAVGGKFIKSVDLFLPGMEACASLARQSAGGAYGQVHAAPGPSGAPASLPRGAVCPAVVGEMSIPEGGTLLDPIKISPTLAFYYENAESHILLHEALVGTKALADCPA